jgi:hypothetical protein
VAGLEVRHTQGTEGSLSRFKKKNGSGRSVTFTTGVIRVEPDRMRVTLPRLGTIKLHESARELARRLEAGTARILSATVRLDGGRWYVSLSCEVDRQITAHDRPGTVVGVDVGITHLAVLSTGQIIENPRHLTGAAKHLRRLARRVSRRTGPHRRTRQDPSKGWIRANGDRSRAYARVANVRREARRPSTPTASTWPARQTTVASNCWRSSSRDGASTPPVRPQVPRSWQPAPLPAQQARHRTGAAERARTPATLSQQQHPVDHDTPERPELNTYGVPPVLPVWKVLTAAVGASSL